VVHKSSAAAFASAERRIAEAARTNRPDLNLQGLGLVELPEGIGDLSHLESLEISRNLLTELPESIGNLTELKQLNAGWNQISILPDSIGNLKSLRRLDLSPNCLTHLPSTIGSLSQLFEIYLDENQLVELPQTMRQLVALRRLYLHGNPLLNIPPEELGRTWAEVDRGGPPKSPRKILNYYFRTLLLEKRPLNEAKLILVGRGGAGKTSLRKRLITGEFDEGEDKTAGIQVTPWSMNVGAEKVKLNVWDFGGQEIMHATHQFFLTKRSLYVLVLNSREGKQEANLEYWLRLIGGYGAGSPTIVVVNKCDQHPLDLAEQSLREKYPFICEFIRTDCKTAEGLSPLRSVIERETARLPDLRTPFPEAWSTLKKKLEMLRDDCITYDAYRTLCDENDEKDDGNQQVLIGFLHDLGAVLHFRDDPRLNDLGVLKPTWVTGGIYGLLNAKELAQSNGVLDINQLGTLLDQKKYPSERHDFLLRLMAKFELCFELPHTGGTKFLIPELLPEEPDELPFWGTDVLGFEYNYNVLPEGLLPRFIVRTHTLSEAGPRWRSGVVLRQRQAEALVRADVQDRRVWLAVRGPGRQPRDLLAVLRGHFEEIHSDISGLVADERVPVPGYPQVKLDYRKLLVREANGKALVEFETDTESIELPLGKLLDNFESSVSRRERATITVQAGGRLYMPNEHHEQNITVGGDLSGIVGITLTNVTQTIKNVQQEDLRTALETLKQQTESLLEQLPTDKAEEAAENLADFAKEAAKEKPRKAFLDVTSKGLIEAASTVATISGPIIETVNKLKTVLGF
jgi:internalin A